MYYNFCFKEEDLRKSGDAKHHHLQEDLHVEVIHYHYLSIFLMKFEFRF